MKGLFLVGVALFAAAVLAAPAAAQTETAALAEEAALRTSLENSARSSISWTDGAAVTAANARLDAYHVGSADRYRRVEVETSVSFTTPHRRNAILADTHFWGPDCWVEWWRRTNFPRHEWSEGPTCEVWSEADGAGARHETRARGVLTRRD